jgi:hypothetical protein
MDPLLMLLRIIHIGSGVLWVGAAFTFTLFVAPSSEVLAPPDRKQFLDEIVGRRRFSSTIFVFSTLTIVAGAMLYWRDSNGLDPGWITSPSGLGSTTGAAARSSRGSWAACWSRPRSTPSSGWAPGC